MEATITTSSNSSSIPANHMMHAGSFTGHVVPGTIFLLMSLCSSIHVYNHYYAARIRGEQYKARHGRPIWCCHNRRATMEQIEALMRICAGIVGITGEVITSYNRELETFTNKMMHAEHITMFLAFTLSAAVDLLAYHRTNCLPPGADYFCGAGALLVELVLFAYHLHGRTLLSTHLHTILIYIIALQTISTIAELMNQQNFIWSLPRIFFQWLQGTWFIQIAFMLFNPLKHNSTLDEQDSESIMVATLYFAVHVIAAFGVQFLFGTVIYFAQGRATALSALSHVRYSKLEDKRDESVSTGRSSVQEDSDHEWAESSKLAQKDSIVVD